MSELVNVTIDGVSVSVPKGTSIIEAAKQAGVLVPHYCYHPSLPSPAVCRMCLVEVEKAPKLLPACVTTVADGNVIHVNSAAAKKAREAVLEFLLINHPLDCPICDQAGECELQNYVFQEGRPGTRYADYAKRFNPVEDFGPDVLYVPNRCILCTRCVRFMENVADDPVLNVSERGDRAFIGIDPDHVLSHPWSGNVVDLCPVGSLISKDFLHKARAWDLDKTASICPGCTQGCNIMVDTRDEVVVRLRPRPNLEVNRHFMCDTGRLDYRWMNRGDRIEVPLVRDGARLAPIDWDGAIARLAGLVRDAKSITVLASGRASTEALGTVARLVRRADVTAVVKVPTGPEAPLAGVPDLSLRAERVPNLNGAQLLGYTTAWAAGVASAQRADLVLVLDAELDEQELAVVAGARAVVLIGTVDDDRLERASLVLPTTTMVEENGTYVNRDQRVQRYFQAKGAPGMARPTWWIGASAAAELDGGSLPATAADAFAELTQAVTTFDDLTYQDLGFVGRVVGRTAEAAR
ncbi:MAG: (2Fe-2S)-binding protein [Gemmatimonadales bacterium]|nr:(2Fe-2S)-binding protein [Gemmatimonadales bacterium]